MKCILLCAGYATRLFPLTENFPKMLLEIEEGKPLLDYILEKVNEVEVVDEIFVITNNKYYNHLLVWSSQKNNIKPIKVVNDNTMSNDDRLGAIGDINYLINKEKIDSELLIIAGDSLFNYSLNDLINFYKEKNAPVVACRTHDDYEELKSFAVVNLDGTKITCLEEKPNEPKSNIAAYAMYVYPKEVINDIKTYLELGNKPDAPGYLVEYLYKIKPTYAYIFDGPFYDVGNHESLKEVREIYKK